jgi:hypothetical protein
MATMGLWEHWSMLWHCWEFSGAYVDIPPVCEYRFFLAICRMEFLSCDFCDFPTCTCQDLPMAHVSITLVSDLTLRCI